MSLDALAVCAKKPYKNRVFLHTLLLDAEETEKRRKKKGPKKKGYTQFLGGLENGQEVVPPFFFKKTGFSKFSKTPIFIAFPEKNGVATIFFQKGYVTKRTYLEAKKK